MCLNPPASFAAQPGPGPRRPPLLAAPGTPPSRTGNTAPFGAPTRRCARCDCDVRCAMAPSHNPRRVGGSFRARCHSHSRVRPRAVSGSFARPKRITCNTVTCVLSRSVQAYIVVALIVFYIIIVFNLFHRSASLNASAVLRRPQPRQEIDRLQRKSSARGEICTGVD